MKKLTRDERCEISALYKAGKIPSKIAQQLNRSISTITRELLRNSIDGEYNFIAANEVATKRRGKHNNPKITSDNWTYVRSLIRQKWSPHQVDKWLKGHPEVGFTVSRETIYQYVKEDREKDGDLYLSLRRVGKPYRHGRFKEYRGKIKDRVDITQRPDIVNKRLRIGDWEVDSVIGCMNQSSIVTLVERLSRYTTIIKVNSKEAVGVAEAIVNRCKANNLPVKTITGDNGLEFAEHVYIAKELGIDLQAILDKKILPTPEQLQLLETNQISPNNPVFVGFEIHNLFEFFMVFVISTGVAAIILFLLTPFLKKMMHGIR